MTEAADWHLPDAARPDARRLIGSMPMAVLLVAPDLSIVSANPAAEQRRSDSATVTPVTRTELKTKVATGARWKAAK